MAFLVSFGGGVFLGGWMAYGVWCIGSLFFDT